MKNSEEFKSEVYIRAEAKKRHIKLQKRRIAVIVPCVAVVILTAILSVDFFDLPSLQKTDSDAATPDGIHRNNMDKDEIQDVAQTDVTADDFREEAAENQAQLPNSQSDGAVVQNIETYAETLDGAPIKTTDYLCIRMFESNAKTDEPYVFAQIIDRWSELENYFEENNLRDRDSFYDFYVDPFDGIFYIAIHTNGYGFKTVTQTDDALQIIVERNEKDVSDGKAYHMMLPLYEKNYDKTKPIEIIKE